jgi:hypothetical protein
MALDVVSPTIEASGEQRSPLQGFTTRHDFRHHGDSGEHHNNFRIFLSVALVLIGKIMGMLPRL